MPHHFALFQVTPEGAANGPATSAAETIKLSDQSLTFEGVNAETSAAQFTYTRGDASYSFDFDMRYYNPSDGASPNRAVSGAYLFVPQMEDQGSHHYSTAKPVVESTQGNFAAEITLTYQDADLSSYQATARIVEGDTTIEFEVRLLGIPLVDGKGKEVVASWTVDGLDNQDVFYTDTNGLEMQKRVRDFRPDFTLDTEMATSANYYPVNQAIAVQDTTKQLQATVMNDRSQGGASLAPGQMELMQHRRLLHDDDKGVGQFLNETDANGLGLAVNARYMLEIVDLATEQSSQRTKQLLTDEPLQIFYSAVPAEEVTKDLIVDLESKRKLASQLSDFDGALKLHMFPEAKNQILIRLENMADLLDGTPAKTPMFDLGEYAQSVFKANNAGAEPASVTITERNLSNNMDYSEMLENKFKWTSESHPEREAAAATYPRDQSETVVALQPQRIRLFRVEYTPAAAPETFTQ